MDLRGIALPVVLTILIFLPVPSVPGTAPGVLAPDGAQRFALKLQLGTRAREAVGFELQPGARMGLSGRGGRREIPGRGKLCVNHQGVKQHRVFEREEGLECQQLIPRELGSDGRHQ